MKVPTKKLKRATEILQTRGLSGVFNHAKGLLRNRREKINYQKWLRREQLTDKKRAEIRSAIEKFRRKPLISVVMPVYNVEEKWLRICIESVAKQLYENLEFCIADDCSPSPHIRKILEEYAAKDERIKVVFRAENGHISAASNSALELATGEFCVLLDHDDELAEDALFYVAKELNEFPETKMIYSDEDMIDGRGRRYAPKFKPDFSRDFLYSLNLITHLSAYRTDVLRKIGGFRVGTEGSQDYDLALRVIEEISEKQIRHIPHILYHWRAIRGSVAFSPDEKPYAHSRAREAIGAHLERTGKKAKVVETVWNLHRVCYDLPEVQPKVSLIFYAENDSAAAQKSSSETVYENLETVFAKGGNAEKLNAAVAETTGEVLVFVDANLKPLAKDWLKELVSFAIQTEIGAVGAQILNHHEKIVHNGLIIGTEEVVSAAYRDFSISEGGNFGRTQLIGNFSAVSIACLCMRRELFEDVGGFDAEHLPNRFFDADFCLKLREKNYRIVFTPYTQLIKIDANKRLNLEENPTASEKEFFAKKWVEIMKRDPFYNPNFSKRDGSFSIEI